jgi:caa(3)-type oxidase subunit IV
VASLLFDGEDITVEKHESATQRSHLVVFAALMALAAISYGISFASLGAMRVPAAIAISVAKASLVAVFFMELIDQRPTNRFVLIAALILVCTLIALMAADVLTRGVPPMLPPP